MWARAVFSRDGIHSRSGLNTYLDRDGTRSRKLLVLFCIRTYQGASGYYAPGGIEKLLGSDQLCVIPFSVRQVGTQAPEAVVTRQFRVAHRHGGFEEPLFGKVGSYFSSFGVLIDGFCDGIRSAF